jgi:hypothetical protein
MPDEGPQAILLYWPSFGRTGKTRRAVSGSGPSRSSRPMPTNWWPAFTFGCSARWLGDEHDPADLMRPSPSEPMRMWPISTRVNKLENDDPSIRRTDRTGKGRLDGCGRKLPRIQIESRGQFSRRRLQWLTLAGAVAWPNACAACGGVFLALSKKSAFVIPASGFLLGSWLLTAAPLGTRPHLADAHGRPTWTTSACS